MDKVTVLSVEPDAALRKHFERILALEADLHLMNQPDFFSPIHNPSATWCCDVLLLDALPADNEMIAPPTKVTK